MQETSERLIMSRREKTLAIKANQQISICCQTLCDKYVVEEYINTLERELYDLRKYVLELEEEMK